MAWLPELRASLRAEHPTCRSHASLVAKQRAFLAGERSDACYGRAANGRASARHMCTQDVAAESACLRLVAAHRGRVHDKRLKPYVHYDAQTNQHTLPPLKKLLGMSVVVSTTRSPSLRPRSCIR